MSKRIIAVLVVLVFTLTLASCAPATTTTTAAPSQTTKATQATQSSQATQQTTQATTIKSRTITFLSSWPTEDKSMGTYPVMTLSEQYKKDINPKFDIELDIEPVTTLSQKVQVLIASDQMPDAFIFEPGRPLLDLAKAGIILNVEEVFKEVGIIDQVRPAALAISKGMTGEMYQAPLGFNIEGIWYNKRIFKENNLKEPESWDELNSICELLNGKGIQPFAPAGKDKWQNTRFLNMTVSRLLGPDVMKRASKGEVSFLDPQFIEAARIISEMASKGYFGGKSVNTIDGATADLMFLQEKVAMYYIGSWLITSLNNPEKMTVIGQDNVGFFNFPNITGGKGNSEYVTHCGRGLTLTKKNYDDQMREWVKYVFSRYGDFMMKSTGRITGFKVNDTSLVLPYYTKLMLEKMDNMKGVTFYFEAFMNSKMEGVAKDNMQILITNEMTPNEYMQLLEDANKEMLSLK